MKLDAARSRVVVGPKAALATHRLRLRDVNWLGDGALDAAATQGLDVLAKVRSTSQPVRARIGFDGEGRIEVRLADGEDGVAPGQACVFYDSVDGARVLGGGFIAEALSDVMNEMPASVMQAAQS